MAVVSSKSLAVRKARHTGHRTGLIRHAVHHVVWQMAVQHPVAGVVSDELDVSRLCDPDKDRIAGPPRRLRDASALGPCGVEGVAVDVPRVMLHTKVHEPDTHSVSLTHHERRRCGTGFAVQEQPIPVHAHGVRRRGVGQHLIFLEMDEEVLVAMRSVGSLGVHDEAPEHAGHLLHRHVRVIEKGAFLLDGEVVGKALAGLDRSLADAGHAVIAELVFKAVPMNRAGLRELVLEDDSNFVALGDLDRRAGRAAVEPPNIDGLLRSDLLFEDVGGEAKHLHVAVHLVGHISYVCGNNWRRVYRPAVHAHLGKRATAHAEVATATGDLTCGITAAVLGGFSYGATGKQSRAQTKSALKKRTTIRHGEKSSVYVKRRSYAAESTKCSTPVQETGSEGTPASRQ